MEAPTRDEHDRFVTIHGIRLHWVETGTPSNLPTVVLLHGLNNSAESWSQLAPLLGTDRRVVMLDLPGHGQSARPDAGYELDWYAHMVAGFIVQLGPDKVDVVGHSFGGGVAQMLLLEIPERIRRLVLIAAGGLGKAVGWWLRLASLPRVVEYLGQPFMALGTRLALRGAHEGISREEIAELSRYNALPGSARAFARSVRDVIDWRGQRRNFLHRVHELKRLPPMLVLWGDRDTLIPVEQGRAFSYQLAGSVLRVFQGCGHYLHNEQPGRVAAEIRRFLDDPAAPEARLRVTEGTPPVRRTNSHGRRLRLPRFVFHRPARGPADLV